MSKITDASTLQRAAWDDTATLRAALEPTREEELLMVAQDAFWCSEGDTKNGLRAALAAVAPLIEAQARERALREAAETIRALIAEAKPAKDGPDGKSKQAFGYRARLIALRECLALLLAPAQEADCA